MAVDKGGLRYPIQATDEYTAAFKGFHKAIDTAKTKLAALGKTSESVARQNDALKKSFAALSKDTASVVKNINAVNKATRSKIAIDKNLVKISKDRATALRSEANAQTKLVQANVRFTQSVRNRIKDEATLLGITQRLATAAKSLTAETAKRIRENRVESSSIRQKVKLLERELTLKRQLSGLKNVFTSAAAQSTGATTQTKQGVAATAASTGQATKGVQTLNQNLKQTESLANRISFTFRRLFGILAAFAAIRALIGGFKSLVTEGINFTAKIEDAKLGIASLLTAVADVNDATGATADSADRLALAQREAARQTELLRKDALETSATFDQLLETFQVALAPGFTSGLAIDEIRKFTVQISQAAQAIALPQNQLAEEIRSILSGTIQARTTRIAVSLGITNDDIKRAKEVGKLFDFLQIKFKAFDQAGKESLNNFNVILSNVRDSILGILAEGFTGSKSIPGFFTALKTELKAVDALLRNSATNKLEFNPDLIKIAKAIGDGLKVAVQQVRILVENLGSGRLISIAQAIGNAFSFAATSASILAEALTKNLSLMTDLVNKAGNFAAIMSGIAPDRLESGLRQFLVILIQVATAGTLLNLAFGGISKTFKLLKTAALALLQAFGFIVTLVVQTALNFGSILGALKSAAIAAGVLLLPFAKIVLAIGAIIGLVFLWEKATKSLVKAVTGLELSFTGIAKLLGNNIVFGINKASLAAERLILQIQRRFTQNATPAFKALTKQIDQLTRKIEALDNQQSINVNNIVDEDARTGKDLKDIFTDVAGAIGNKFSEVNNSLFNATTQAKTFADVLRELPPIITQSVKPIDESTEALKELTQTAIKASDELDLARETLGLEKEAAEQVKLAFEGQVQLREATSTITKQEAEQQKKIAEAILLRNGAAKELLFSETKIQEKVKGLLGIAEQERAVKDSVNKLEKERLDLAAREAVETDERIKKSINDVLKTKTSQLEVEKKILEAVQNSANAFGTGLGEKDFERTKRIFENVLKAQGLQSSAEKNLKDLKNQRLQVEQQILKTINDQITALALQQAQEKKNENLELTAELTAARKEVADIRSKPLEFVTPEEAEIIQAEIQLLETKKRILQENARIEKASITLQISELQRNTITGINPDIIARQAALSESLKNTKLQTELLNAEIDKLNEKIKLQQELAEASPLQTLAIGAREAFKEVAEEVENTFLIVKDIIRDTINSTSRFIADAIVDAFDPTNKTSLREKFARFLQEIAKEVIAVLVKIAIVKSILGLGSLLGGGAAEGGEVGTDVGRAKGGRVPRRGKASPAHFFAPQGRAEGGHALRPRGLDPRDTVPIWTQPGEYIMKRSSVLQYGSDVMRQINEGLIDAGTLRALATSHKVHTPRSNKRGFAEGGVVAPALRIREQTQSQGVGVATVISSEKEFDRLLAGGDKTLIRWMGKNKHKIKPILGDRR